jgi:signal transduction histidine kinase
MKDRDDPRAALSVAVAAGRIAAVVAAFLLHGQVPSLPVAAGLACAIGLSLTRRFAVVCFLVATDLTLAIVLGLAAAPTAFTHIALAGAAAQAGAALGLVGALIAIPTFLVAWWAPLGGLLTAGLLRLWRELLARRTRAVWAAAAAERARLAREMHDSLSKTIDAIALGAAALPYMLGEPDRAARLADTLRDGSLTAARDARDLIDELRSAPVLQLTEDLPRLCREWTNSVGVPVEVRVSGLEPTTPVAAELAWILREALRNTAAHARAGRVRVTLAGDDDQVTLTIEDDGVGLVRTTDPARLLQAGHHGLVGMAERARVCGGSLAVDLSPLGGTRIAATVPRNAAPAPTGMPLVWRIGTIAAAAAGCGALIVFLSTIAPTTPSISAPISPAASLAASAPPSPPAAAASAVPSPSAAPAHSAAPALACRVKYAKQTEWQVGFVVDMTLTNTGTQVIDGWQMTFTFTNAQKITNSWGAAFTQNGGHITADGTSSISRIAPSKSVTFGFQATRNGPNPIPASFLVNGVRCATPY